MESMWKTFFSTFTDVFPRCLNIFDECFLGSPISILHWVELSVGICLILATTRLKDQLTKSPWPPMDPCFDHQLFSNRSLSELRRTQKKNWASISMQNCMIFRLVLFSGRSEHANLVKTPDEKSWTDFSGKRACLRSDNDIYYIYTWTISIFISPWETGLKAGDDTWMTWGFQSDVFE